MWWRGTVSQILYCLQYVSILDGRAAFEMSRAIVAHRCLESGPEAYLEAIEAALAQGGSVRTIPTPHADNDFRSFLYALAAELRKINPWPPPPIVELKLGDWDQLVGVTQPIGRIELRQLEVSQRLGFEFGEAPGTHQRRLLLHLDSGIVIGLSAPLNLSDSGIVVFAGGNFGTSRVVEEIHRVIGLDQTDLTLFAPPSDRPGLAKHPLRSQQRSLMPDLTPQASGVERWSPDQLARHRAVIDEEGRFRTIDGGRLDTRMATASWRPNAELALFILDPHGNFYVSLRRVVSRIHHSTLSGGGPVAAAGELRVRDGHLLGLTDHSGHYPPTHSSNRILIDELQHQGVTTTDVLFDFAASE
jgi:hypothetical protein